MSTYLSTPVDRAWHWFRIVVFVLTLGSLGGLLIEMYCTGESIGHIAHACVGDSSRTEGVRCDDWRRLQWRRIDQVVFFVFLLARSLIDGVHMLNRVSWPRQEAKPPKSAAEPLFLAADDNIGKVVVGVWQGFRLAFLAATFVFAVWVFGEFVAASYVVRRMTTECAVSGNALAGEAWLCHYRGFWWGEWEYRAKFLGVATVFMLIDAVGLLSRFQQFRTVR